MVWQAQAWSAILFLYLSLCEGYDGFHGFSFPMGESTYGVFSFRSILIPPFSWHLGSRQVFNGWLRIWGVFVHGYIGSMGGGMVHNAD